MSTSSVLGSVLAATTGSSSSAIDVASTVATILYADRAPERAWQAQQATLASQTSAINQLSSESSSLTDALSALQDPNGDLTAVTASSSDPGIVTASAVAGTTIRNHTVIVNSLATTAAWYSASVATSSTPLASGSFTLTTGGVPTQIAFGGSAGAPDTLDQLAASINSQSLGVSATVVTGSSGSRLSLVANASGGAANFSVSQASGLTFTQASPGADASITFDGVPGISSSSNTVTVSGLTLNLLEVSPGASTNPSTATPVQLTLAPNSDAISEAVSSFVSAYNKLITDVNSQFAYNSATQTAGTLSGDSTVQGLQGQLLDATNYSSGSGTLQSLDSLGISTNQDGTLTLDATTLANAVSNNPAAVTSFFQGSASNGFVNSLQTSLNTYTDPTQGAFTVELSSISSENTDLTNQTNTLELYLATQQTALTTQYNNADIALTELPNEIKQLDALLNGNSSSNG